jgi:hypothetical protein
VPFMDGPASEAAGASTIGAAQSAP